MKTHSKTRAFCNLIILILLFSLGASPFQSERAAPASQTIVYQEDFNDGQAQGWGLEPGWQISAEGGNQVLAGQGHYWARSNQSFQGDYRLTYRLKLAQGTIHLNDHLNDTGRYFIGFTQDWSSLNQQFWPDEFHHDLARRDAYHSLNTWHQIELVSQGGMLSLSVDGTQEWSHAIEASLAQGSFAFETLDGSRAYIDDVVVTQGSTQPQIAPTTRPAAQPGMGLNFTWVRTGGPLGGLGYDIRMRPDNPDIMYVTDAKAGVFKSTDGGNNWVPKNNGITTRAGTASDEIPVFCLTIDPNNYDTIWVGTQFQRGFFKSTDGGETWKSMDSGVMERGMTTRGFGVDPHNSDVVYAAGEISSWEWAGVQRMGREFDLTKGVVYKTTNGGQTWKKVWGGDNLARYVWINPRDTNILYVSTGIFDREAANSDVLHGKDGGVGVIKSTDGGNTWQQINNGLHNMYVGSLFMHPQNPDVLLAGTGTAWEAAGVGVYLTTDGGQNWKQTLPDVSIRSVEFSSTDPQIAYAGGFESVHRSEDGGLTWKLMSGPGGWGTAGVMAGHPFDFQVDPRNPDRIFSNQYSGGNFLSLDGGRTWESASKGYTGSAIRDVVVDPAQPGRVIVAARSGIFASYNGGEDWVGLSFRPYYFPDWHVVAIDPGDPQHLISGMTCWRNLVNSSDGGQSWYQTKQFSTNIAFDTVAFAPSYPKTVYAGSAGFISCGHFTSDVPSSGFNATTRMPGAGVFISQDGGETWNPSPDPQMQALAISRLAVDPQNAGKLFAATFHRGLFLSTDGGQSWNPVRGGLPENRSITSVHIDPHDSNNIYAGRNQGGLYRSTDGGASWRQVTAGLPAEGVITDIVFDPINPQVLYAAEVFSGAYRSQDGGNSWQAINTGLLVRSINALAVSSDGLHVYAATEGNGVYRLDLNGQPPAAAPSPESLAPSIPQSPPTQAANAKAVPLLPLRQLPCCGTLFVSMLLLGLVWSRSRGQLKTR